MDYVPSVSAVTDGLAPLSSNSRVKMRRMLLVVVALMVMAPAGVSAQQPTKCEANFDGDVSPGLSSEPTSGTFTSNGPTGSVVCDGPVNGKRPTGPGTWGRFGPLRHPGS